MIWMPSKVFKSAAPSDSPWMSVTVYADSALYAEAFAKALLIAGPAEAESLLAQVNGLQFAAVEADGEVVGTLENMEMNNVPEPVL